ncbi:Ada metal-binding domain-containing protein [Bacillus carboniphilus]|uniref:Ada metal-binding domain-containing protein n=1 Tax=Bacillus carboniphilus TaxID=86663 RepID=A0ABY9JY56_9BACI|nr:Ada metal-binding domain-containing protein [Bacillus carboniphilus]WLR42530.1 Ada metal-binding domain-containing protein [Bacillus carboniphilus]
MKILTKDEMWSAIIQCDRALDGVFFYGVKTTSIFCRPSCKSKNPKLENVRFFSNPEDALNHGFRPCKRCKPDFNNSVYHPSEELIQNSIDFLNNNFRDCHTLEDIAKAMNVSRFHLNRTFKKHTGQTPRIYLEMIKVTYAKTLLENTSLKTIDICYQSGFNSLSTFYSVFKRHTGESPQKHRNHI